MSNSTKTPDEPGSKADKFEPPGINFKAKLIGIEDVAEARGDQMCLETMGRLKALVKEKGEHKQKMVVNVSLEGIKLIDEKTLGLNHTHEVHKISFISRDPSDRRAFGYVYGEEGNHKLFAIKTAQQADILVQSLKELFQAVLELKQQQMSVQKQKLEGTTVYLESSYDDPTGQPSQSKVENGGVVQEMVKAEATASTLYAVPGNDAEGVKQRALSNLVDLEKEMKTIQEGISTMSDFDLAFDSLPPKTEPEKSAFSAGDPFAPASTARQVPVPPAPSQGSVDLFSVQTPTSNTPAMPTRKSSDDLFAEFSDTFTSPAPPTRPAPSLPMPSQPPPANPFAVSFGGGSGFGGGYGGGFGQSAPGAFQSGGYQQPAPAAFQSAWGPPQPQAQQMSGFGATSAQHSSDPFGSGFGSNGGGRDFDAFTLQPQPTAPPSAQKEVAKKPDPFGDIAVLGSKSTDTKKAKDPFAGFKMAKPGEVAVPSLKPPGQEQIASGNLKSNLKLDIDGNDEAHDSSEEFSLPPPQGLPPPLPTNIEFHIESMEDSVEIQPPPPPPPPRPPRQSTSPKGSISPPPIAPRSNTNAPALPILPRHRPPSTTSTLSSSSLPSETDSSRGPPSTVSPNSLSTPSPSMTRNPYSCPSKLAYSPLLENDNEPAVNDHSHPHTTANLNSHYSSSTGDLCQDNATALHSTSAMQHIQALHDTCNNANSQSYSKSLPSDSHINHRQSEHNCCNSVPPPHERVTSLSPTSALDGLANPSLLSSSAPTNNSFHVSVYSHLSSSVSNPSLNKVNTKLFVPTLPKHEDPFADDPFKPEEAQSVAKTIISNDSSTCSDNWADFTSHNRMQNPITTHVKQNGGLTNISSNAWTDPFGAPAAGGKKGITTSDGQPLFDNSPFGDFDFK